MGKVTVLSSRICEHHELALSLAARLTPRQAVMLTTRNAARLLNLSDRGTIAPGPLTNGEH